MALPLPGKLIKELHFIKGFDEEAFKEIHISGEQVTSVRLNPEKTGGAPSSIFNTTIERVKWSEHGYYLK